MTTYFAFVTDGRGKWDELLVTRKDGRQVSQEPTGVVYATAKAANDGVGAKNRALTLERHAA